MNKIAPSADLVGKKAKGEPDNIQLGADDKKGEEKDDTELLKRARKRFERADSAESDNRRSWVSDKKFKSGDQWPTEIAIQRNQEKRPCLTYNRTKTFVKQVTGDLRQNRPAINVSPVGDRGDVDAAKVYRGLIRAIERDCSADICYDTAANDMVTCGRGILWIVTEYDRADSFDQVLRLKRVRNMFTVYLDPDAQEPDFADGKWAFVTEMIPREDFKLEHPDADQMNWPQAGVGEGLRNWIEATSVRVAWYYEVKVEPRRLVQLDNGHTGFYDELSDDVRARIDSGSMKVVNDRTSEKRTVKCYKLTAVEVLEEWDWVGSTIPIVPMIGDEEDIEGKVKISGLVRDTKDAQTAYNFFRTLEAEMIGLQPKAPFIGVEGQFEGHETEWKQANTKNLPYLEYKPTDVRGQPAPPPQRQPMLGSLAGVEGALMGAAQDMQAITGIRFDATKNERMEDESGKAIRELRRSGDLTTYDYPANMGRALRRVGNILIEAIPKVYNTKRILTILREDDTEERVQIDADHQRPYQETTPAPTPDQPNPKRLKIFNPKIGRYGVTTTIGPSYATKRIEASESMVAFAKAVPNVAALIADLIAKNQDWPGAEEIAKRLAKAVPPQLMTADQQDLTPQVQAMMQAMDRQIKMLMMERQKLVMALTEKVSDRALAKDKINKDFEAKILKVLADLQKAEVQAESAKISDLAGAAKELMGEMQGDGANPVDVAIAREIDMEHQLEKITAKLGKPKGVTLKKSADGGYELTTDYSEDKPAPKKES